MNNSLSIVQSIVVTYHGELLLIGGIFVMGPKESLHVLIGVKQIQFCVLK